MNHEKSEDQRLADMLGRRPWGPPASDLLAIAVLVLLSFVVWKLVTMPRVQTVYNVAPSCAPCTS